MRAVLLATITLLAGCPLQGTHSATLGGGGSSNSSSSASSNPSERERPVRAGEEEQPREKLYFEREDFHSLRGLTVEQAKAAAKKLGHTGGVKVSPMDEFIDGCKPNTVCTATDERGGQSGMSLKETLLLQTNKTLEIAPPPD